MKLIKESGLSSKPYATLQHYSGKSGNYYIFTNLVYKRNGGYNITTCKYYIETRTVAGWTSYLRQKYRYYRSKWKDKIGYFSDAASGVMYAPDWFVYLSFGASIASYLLSIEPSEWGYVKGFIRNRHSGTWVSIPKWVQISRKEYTKKGKVGRTHPTKYYYAYFQW